MIPYYFLDTNILLYGLSRAADHRAKRGVARSWIARSDWGVSTQVLMEFSVNASQPRHGLSKETVRMLVQEFIDGSPVQGMDAHMVASAHHIQARYGLSLWDAAIVAAAQRMGCMRLITEDLNHGQDYGGVVALNPFVEG